MFVTKKFNVRAERPQMSWKYSDKSSKELDQIVRRLDGISSSVLDDIIVTHYDASLNLIQINYKEKEGEAISTEASEQRGKIFDTRTNRAIVGGSTYTHLAVSSNEKINISPIDGTIRYDEIDKNGNFLPRQGPSEMIFPTPAYAHLYHEAQMTPVDRLMREVHNAQDKVLFRNAEANQMTFAINLANDDDVISGAKTFIRPYVEGTHVYVYLFEGLVRFANHSNVNIEGISQSKDSAPKHVAGYGDISFMDEWRKMNGFQGQELFDLTKVRTSPYVYRFLIAAKGLQKASRLQVQGSGFIVFIGVQKMWNYNSNGPYQYGEEENPKDPRPYAGAVDERSYKEVLDLQRVMDARPEQFRLEIKSSLVHGNNPFVYYPRDSFGEEECNDFLNIGYETYSSDREEILDFLKDGDYSSLLYPGESLMMTTYFKKGYRIHVKNVKLMSMSYYYRYKHQGGASTRNNMIRFSLLSAGLFIDHEIPFSEPYDIIELDDTFNYPDGVSEEVASQREADNLREINYMQRPFNTPVPATAEKVKEYDNFQRRLMAVSVFLYIVSPVRQLEALKVFINFISDMEKLAEWIAQVSIDHDFKTDTVADTSIGKAIALTLGYFKQIIYQDVPRKVEYYEALSDEDKLNSSPLLTESEQLVMLHKAAHEAIFQGMNFLDCEDIIKYIGFTEDVAQDLANGVVRIKARELKLVSEKAGVGRKYKRNEAPAKRPAKKDATYRKKSGK